MNLLQRGLASLERLWTIFEAQPDIDDRDVPASPVSALRGEIEFRNLTFSYNGNPILKNVDLKIPAGRTVAIVGATGSGKSTLVSLIPRLYDGPEGSVLEVVNVAGVCVPTPVWVKVWLNGASTVPVAVTGLVTVMVWQAMISV